MRNLHVREDGDMGVNDETKNVIRSTHDGGGDGFDLLIAAREVLDTAIHAHRQAVGQ